MRTTNISKNDSLLKTRTVQINVIASQPPIQRTEKNQKHAVNKFTHSLAKHYS